jgi:ferredoxin-nitrite reductase
VWQNLLISDIPAERIESAKNWLEALDLDWSATNLRGGLIACTGNAGCKFSATDTKGQAMAIAAYLEGKVSLDQPVNIHLTGCHHSCAQHYVGDIGLLGAKVGPESGEGDAIEGYHLYVGGGAGAERKLAREVWRDVAFAEVPAKVERMLKAYLAHRRDGESFHGFTNRHDLDALRALFAEAT